MPDGDVFAFGYKPFNNIPGTFVEKYDVAANKWELKVVLIRSDQGLKRSLCQTKEYYR